MDRDTKQLKDFQRWFARYIQKQYGKKCRSFTWSCAVCHAHFLKDVLDDFVSDTIATEQWHERKRHRSH